MAILECGVPIIEFPVEIASRHQCRGGSGTWALWEGEVRIKMTDVSGGSRTERVPREGNAGEEEGETTRREREHRSSSSARPDTLGLPRVLCSAQGRQKGVFVRLHVA